MKSHDTLLIGFDRSHGGDTAVLIIGRKNPGDAVQVVNAFQGNEAIELYKKLTEKRCGS